MARDALSARAKTSAQLVSQLAGLSAAKTSEEANCAGTVTCGIGVGACEGRGVVVGSWQRGERERERERRNKGKREGTQGKKKGGFKAMNKNKL